MTAPADDLRAAVAARIITGARAARLTAPAEARAGRRSAGGGGEPFAVVRDLAGSLVSAVPMPMIAGVHPFAAVAGGWRALPDFPPRRPLPPSSEAR